MPGKKLVSRLGAVPLTWFGAVLGAVALGVSGLFHGLAPVAPAGIPTVAVGAVDAGGPWNVTVTAVRVVADLSPVLHLRDDGDRWFVVLATVEITADEPRSDVADAIRLAGVAGLRHDAPDDVLVSSDVTRVGYLNPGMPEKLAFVWEQSGTAPVPEVADVRIIGKTRRVDTLTDTATATGHLDWLDPAVRGQVRVPVQDRRT